MFKNETFSLFYKMYFNSHVIFSREYLIVVHLNFHCIFNFIVELCHKIYVNNANIGIHWEQRTECVLTLVKKNPKNQIK